MNDQNERFPHLTISRALPVTSRRPGQPPRRARRDIGDPREHGQKFLDELRAGVIAAREQETGRDSRPLLSFEFADDGAAEEFTSLAEFEVVSQESGRVVLAFASDRALRDFEARLAGLVNGEAVTRRTLLFALDSIAAWSPAQRTGRALRVEGAPPAEQFVVDVDLWPIERTPIREGVSADFQRALREREIQLLDSVQTASTILFRLVVTRGSLGWLLNHRDVRQVDLPPRWDLSRSDLETYLQAALPIEGLPDDAPSIAVLDTGVTAGHPLIAPVLGDAQSFYSAKALPASDDHGHGTFVAGLAAYGDISKRLPQGLSCDVRLLSGRVLDSQAEYTASIGIDQTYDASIIANDVRRAVEYFRGQYNCRVFCVSFGDLRKPYVGGHLTGLAVAMDEMSREYDVLFVVASGNVLAIDLPADVQDTFPNHLFELTHRIIDPATAINVISVGSVARRESDEYQLRYQNDPRHQAIARRDEPSPFTRCGPSVAGVIKPDIVYFGGNIAVDRATVEPHFTTRGLGEVSTRHDFAQVGSLLKEDFGSSVAAPVIAHHAARLMVDARSNSPMLARAILAAHSAMTPALKRLLRNHEKIRNAIGYGLLNDDALHESLENVVTLTAEESIGNKRHHFFELPISTDFFAGDRRPRTIHVALSHFPPVKTTRIQYKEARLSFKLVAGTLEYVSTMFNADTGDDDYESIPEFGLAASLGVQARSRGSLQSCCFSFTKSREPADLVLVVTRNDRSWSSILEEDEKYALAVVLSDKQALESRLYSHAQQQLRIRARAQIQVT